MNNNITHFNNWFEQDYHNLQRKLKRKNCYNEDVFNETYLRMYEAINRNATVSNYQSYFIRSYYCNNIQHRIEGNKYCSLSIDPEIHKKTNKETNLKDLETQNQALENEVMSFVYDNFELQEFELFKMYFNLKPAINYKTLSEITHIEEYKIGMIISKIKKRVRRNKKLADKYQQIEVV